MGEQPGWRIRLMDMQLLYSGIRASVPSYQPVLQKRSVGRMITDPMLNRAKSVCH
ncbi:hypothetical protein DENSPDRAFT_839644, partial [Dentipellis sp. KUC8613]